MKHVRIVTIRGISPKDQAPISTQFKFPANSSSLYIDLHLLNSDLWDLHSSYAVRLMFCLLRICEEGDRTERRVMIVVPSTRHVDSHACPYKNRNIRSHGSSSSSWPLSVFLPALRATTAAKDTFLFVELEEAALAKGARTTGAPTRSIRSKYEDKDANGTREGVVRDSRSNDEEEVLDARGGRLGGNVRVRGCECLQGLEYRSARETDWLAIDGEIVVVMVLYKQRRVSIAVNKV